MSDDLKSMQAADAGEVKPADWKTNPAIPPGMVEVTEGRVRDDDWGWNYKSQEWQMVGTSVHRGIVWNLRFSYRIARPADAETAKPTLPQDSTSPGPVRVHPAETTTTTSAHPGKVAPGESLAARFRVEVKERCNAEFAPTPFRAYWSDVSILAFETNDEMPGDQWLYMTGVPMPTNTDTAQAETTRLVELARRFVRAAESMKGGGV